MVILHSTHTYEVAQYLHCVCVHVCMFAGVQMYVCGIRACVWVGVTPVNCMCVWERLCVCTVCCLCCGYCATSHVAVCCSVLQCVAVCGSVLQCVAVCCRVLQCVAVPLLWVLCHFTGFARLIWGRSKCSPSFLIHRAECCSALQCVAACCRSL